MVDFETKKEATKKYANDKKFIEVSRKICHADEGDTEFISIACGSFSEEGQKKFRKCISIPIDKELTDFVSDEIKKMFE